MSLTGIRVVSGNVKFITTRINMSMSKMDVCHVLRMEVSGVCIKLSNCNFDQYHRWHFDGFRKCGKLRSMWWTRLMSATCWSYGSWQESISHWDWWHNFDQCDLKDLCCNFDQHNFRAWCQIQRKMDVCHTLIGRRVVWSRRKVVWSREKHMKMADDANLLPGEQGFISQYKSPYKPLNNRQVGVSIICDRLFHFSNAPYHHQKERGKWADKYWQQIATYQFQYQYQFQPLQ